MSGDPAHARQRPPAPLASAWGALCRLSATGPWLWLVRSPAPGGFAAKIIKLGAYAPEAAAPLRVVLLDRLPGLLVALGAEVVGHG